jgi:hypothetical protein
MRRARCLIAIATVALAGCSATHFTEKDLHRLVLQKKDAPVGTEYIDGSSGFKSLDEYAKTDTVKRTQLEDAGFITSYFSFFLSPNFYQGTEGRISPQGSIADSFALLFKTPEGAIAGLQTVEEAVRRDGKDLIDVPADTLGEEAFGLKGRLDVHLPPGFLFAWREGNAVLGLVAAGAPDNVDENAVRVLVDRMRARQV